jgi:hypothetical protein
MTTLRPGPPGPQSKKQGACPYRWKRRHGHAYQSFNAKPECCKVKEKNARVANNF